MVVDTGVPLPMYSLSEMACHFTVGTSVTFDAEKNQIVLENFSAEPVKLNVSRVE